MDYRCYGWILALLASATVALGVADLILTTQFYCNGQDYSATYCSNTGEPYVWVWVASGVWGGVPIFFTALFLVCSGTSSLHLRYVTLCVMLSAIVFSPAIIILTAIELWRGSTSTWYFYNFASGGLSAGNIQPNGTNPWQAKFAIPLSTAILGGLMFIMTAWLTLSLWCSNSQAAVVEQAPAPEPCARPQIMAPPPAPCQPCGQQVYGHQPYAPLPCSPCNIPVRYSGGCPPGYTCGGGVFNNFASSSPNSFYYTNTR